MSGYKYSSRQTKLVPPDLNKETKDKILKSLSEGAWKRDAAEMAGISHDTFYRWCKEDLTFLTQVKAAILEYKHTLIKVMTLGSIKDWKAAAEILKTRWPKQWNRSQRVEVVRPEDKVAKVLAIIEEATKDKTQRSQET